MTARLHVRVQPGGRRTGFTGWFGDQPRLAVAAPPVVGAANDAVCTALADVFGLRQRQVRLLGGASSRTKRFGLDGIDDDQVAARLTVVNPRPPSI